MSRWRSGAEAAKAVASENRAAAGGAADPRDPRWALAVRARAQLQGGLMTPERRRRVMRTARALGIRPFDASVIIALMQDQARRGLPAPLPHPCLQMIPAVGRRRGQWALPLAAVGTALLAAFLAIRWLLA
jgi:hypothetical protein